MHYLLRWPFRLPLTCMILITVHQCFTLTIHVQKPIRNIYGSTGAYTKLHWLLNANLLFYILSSLPNILIIVTLTFNAKQSNKGAVRASHAFMHSAYACVKLISSLMQKGLNLIYTVWRYSFIALTYSNVILQTFAMHRERITLLWVIVDTFFCVYWVKVRVLNADLGY